jgi:hypothetical protein
MPDLRRTNVKRQFQLIGILGDKAAPPWLEGGVRLQKQREHLRKGDHQFRVAPQSNVRNGSKTDIPLSVDITDRRRAGASLPSRERDRSYCPPAVAVLDEAALDSCSTVILSRNVASR